MRVHTYPPFRRVTVCVHAYVFLPLWDTYVRGGILCVCMRVCWLVTLLRSPNSSHVDIPCRNLYSL